MTVSSTQFKLVYPSGRTLTYTKDASGFMQSVTDGKGTWTYHDPSPYPGATLVFNSQFPNNPRAVSWDATTGNITNDLISGGPTSYYAYDTYGRVTSAKVGGVETDYSYDTRGNVIGTRRISVTPGTPADTTASASFPTSCGNPKTCNKPDYTIDAKGLRTDYTYDPPSGNVATITLPAAPSGIRPQVRYQYSAVTARFRDGTGAIINGPAFYRLTSVSRCATTASCVGTADEIKTVYTYDQDAAGQPTAVTQEAGDGSLAATTTFTYTPLGDVETVDGPLPGTDDTTRYYYDLSRRLIGSVDPDPDGGGPRLRRAVRNTYNDDGQLIVVEIGTVTNQGDNAFSTFVSLQKMTYTYDLQGRIAAQKASSGATTYAVTQYDYDQIGLTDCVAQRMNPAAFVTLPASACSTGTAGSFGPDRITQYAYDNVQRLTGTTTAFGTADAVTESLAYNANGLVSSVTDGQNNVTSYTYDGFDRLARTLYPLSTSGSGSSSTTDYEQLSYDADDEITTRRLRDATSIAFTYDNLGHVILKNLPGSEKDVTSTYDLLGRQTGATTSAQSLGFTYDALGRITTQTGPLGVMTAQFDVAGRRTRLTWPDAFYVTYDYDSAGRMTAIRENGATSGIGVLATFGYDDLGNRTSLVRGNGTTTSYTFDAISRLHTLAHDFAGSTQDLLVTYAYNPSGQIVSATHNIDTFAHGNYANMAKSYSINGLNQTTIAGTDAIGYDARGNISSAGADSYTYSSENTLLTGPASASLTYDPLSRLYQESGASSLSKLQYDGLDMVGEYDTYNALQKRYVFGPGADEPLIEYDNVGGVFTRAWLYADERGSVIGQADDTGALTAVNTYDEYGIPDASNAGRFGYTGQQWLPELGMYYYKSRVYSSRLGKFLQTDPAEYGDGLNWYNYAHGDSINGRDPSGMDDSWDGSDIIVQATCRTAPETCAIASSNLLAPAPSSPGGDQRSPSFGQRGPQNPTLPCSAANQAGKGLRVTLGFTNTPVPGTSHTFVVVTDLATGNRFASRAGPWSGPGGGSTGRITAVSGAYGQGFPDYGATTGSLGVGNLNVSFEQATRYMGAFAQTTNSNNLMYGYVVQNSNSYAAALLKGMGFTPPSTGRVTPGYNSNPVDPSMVCH